MTFSFYAPPSLSPEQAGGLPSLIGSILNGATEAKKARYQQMLQEAQAKQAMANVGYLGEETKGKNIENQYLPQKMQATIDLSKANAQKAKLMQMIQEQLLGSGDSGGAPQSTPQVNQPSMQSGTTPSFPQGQYALTPEQIQRLAKAMPPPKSNQPTQMMNAPDMSQPEQNQSTRGLNYAKAATAMHLLGLGKPQVVDANGKYMAITPFGNIDTGVAGLTAKDTALAKEDAKKISGLENTVLIGSQKQATFDALNEDLGSPQFEEMRQNPILGKHEIGWYQKFGTKSQQEMIGRIKTHLGDIVKNFAQDFKGQFRVGEQALANEMKPYVGDSLDVMKGKSEALTYMNQLLTKRAEMEAQLMRSNNISALEARIAADKIIKPAEIRKEVRAKLYRPSRQPTLDEIRAEKERRQAQGLNNG